MKPLIDRLHERFSDKEINKVDEIPDIGEWEHFLKCLPIPEDSIDMAFNKYLCRMHYFPWHLKQSTARNSAPASRASSPPYRPRRRQPQTSLLPSSPA